MIFYDHIIDNIYIGPCPLKEDIDDIVDRFGAILSLTDHDDYIDYSKTNILYTHVRFEDGELPGEESIEYCLSWIRTFKDLNKDILIHCDAGCSRSPFILALYLIKTYNLSVDFILAFIKSKRKCIDPASIYVEYLRHVNGESIDAKNTVLASILKGENSG